jgi:hypothetical protein
MQLREFVGYHSGISNLTFFLLYDVSLLGKWLQTFRQIVSHFKRKEVEGYSALFRYNHHFSSKSAGNH